MVRTVFIFIASLLLYLPFLSVQYDLNGINEAEAIRNGDLIARNHLLYRPVAATVLWFFSHYVAGDPQKYYVALQVLTAVTAGLSVAVLFIFLRRHAKHSMVAAVGVFWFATTPSFWRFSIDVYYMPLAVLCVCVMLYVLLNEGFLALSLWLRCIVLACLTVLAITAWQALILLTIPVSYIILTSTWFHTSRKGRVALTGAYLVATGVITLLLYGIVGLIDHQVSDITDIIPYILGYDGTTLPVWGSFATERITPLVEQMYRSLFVSRWIVPLVVLCTLLGLYLAQDTVKRWLHHIIAVILSYSVFLPFLFWWDPYEAKWFVVPNLFLVVGVTLLIARSQERQNAQKKHTRVKLFGLFKQHLSKMLIIGFISMVVVQAVLTGYRIVLPLSQNVNQQLSLASCVAQQMDDNDIFLETDWNWPGYLRYFYGKDVVSIFQQPEFSSNILGVQADQQVVYLDDFPSYTEIHQEWLEQQTGFTDEDFAELNPLPAFTCGDVQIYKAEP
ncbi:MAG: hypothetical protein ACOCXQ_01220 [Patescibacteria group bacterium]